MSDKKFAIEAVEKIDGQIYVTAVLPSEDDHIDTLTGTDVKTFASAFTQDGEDDTVDLVDFLEDIVKIVARDIGRCEGRLDRLEAQSRKGRKDVARLAKTVGQDAGKIWDRLGRLEAQINEDLQYTGSPCKHVSKEWFERWFAEHEAEYEGDDEQNPKFLIVPKAGSDGQMRPHVVNLDCE